jgi:hypothetical protein
MPQGQRSFPLFPVHQGGRSRISNAAIASDRATHASAWATVRMIDIQPNNRHSKLHVRAVAAYNAAEEKLARIEGRAAEPITAADWAVRNAEGVVDRSRR